MAHESSGVILESRALVKHFGHLVAVDQASIQIRRGEVAALLGENGAGKTTLLKMLNGYLRPDRGAVLHNGRQVRFHSPREAVQHKIYTVYQSFSLVENFTVKQNLILAFSERPDAHIKNIIDQYGRGINLDAQVSTLPTGIKQRLEIVKALESEAEVLLLDEPTSVLAYEERDRFFADLKRSCRGRGIGVLITTHKLQDVIDYCDRVTVMKLGRVVLEKNVEETSIGGLTRAMFGATTEYRRAEASLTGAERRKILEVEHLHVSGDNVPLAVNDVTFSLHEGEILGIIGVAGNGQTELADTIYGIRQPSKGEIRPGEKFEKARRQLSISRIAFVSDDPIQYGLALNLSVKENFGITVLDQLSNGMLVNWKGLSEFATGAVQEFETKYSSLEEPLGQLSGGNMQKVVIGRELNKSADILIAVHPAHGLDLSATYRVYNKLRKLAENGTSIFLISEDIDEVLDLADRIGVMFEGRLSEIKPTFQWTKQTIGAKMTGAGL